MVEMTMPHGDPTTIVPPPKQPVLAYVVCLVVMALIGSVGILALEVMRPDKDNTQITATLMSMLAPTSGVLILLIHNAAAIKEVHMSVNSRLTELVAATKTAALATGREQGRSEVGVALATPQPAPVSGAPEVGVPVPGLQVPVLLLPEGIVSPPPEGEKLSEP